MTEYSYTITHVTSSTDITGDVAGVTVNEAMTGEISSCVIRLEALNGKYLNEVAATDMDEYDLIRVQITDDESATFDKLYEIDNIVPIQSVQEGNVVELECLGLEHHLQKFYFAKQFQAESAFDTLKEIISQYNDNKASLQPEIVGHDATTYNDGTVVHDTNELPQWTANDYNFNIAEKKVYDGAVEVVEKLGSTVAAGGANDFFELYFTKHSTDNTKLVLQAFASGSDPTGGNEITITDTDAVNADPTEGGIGSTAATVVASWGADGFGTVPTDTAKFAAELEAFRLHKHWESISGGYPTGARVQLDGVHYESDIDDNTSTPGVANWTSKEIKDYLGASEYSPWTNDKAAQFKNSGSATHNPASGSFDLPGCWDSNLVIWDNDRYRTQVVQRVNTDAVGATLGQIASQYLHSATTPYRGFRVLVDPNIGAIGGVFATNGGLDRFGVAYSKNIVQHNGSQNGDYTDWDVFRVTSDDEEVAVTHEGIIYERQSGTWTDNTGTNRANDAFHIYSSIATDAGVNETEKSTGPTVTYGDTSAIRSSWAYDTVDLISSLVFNNANYYKMGAWLNLRFPYPFSTYNSVGTMGSLWGNNTTTFEPATFDTNNMHLTHSGQTSFNVTEAEEHGPCSALQFAMKIVWAGKTSGTNFSAGDFKMRCFMYDTSDNVVVQDFVLATNNLWQDVSLPVDNFKIYRARTPARTVEAIFLLHDLDITNSFEFKNIKMIGFQWQESYNDEGQYLPEFGRVFLDTITEGGATVELHIDRLHWAKPLLAVTDPVTTGRSLTLEFRQQPLISNYLQLKQDALSWLEVAQFRHKQYDVKTEGRLDIDVGDTFFLEKADMVLDDDTRTADTGGSANTIRLVAKNIVYKISKTASESGHFVRYITGIKRILS